MKNLEAKWGLAAVVGAALFGAVAAVAPAQAETIKEACETSLTAEGQTDLSGCACLQDKSAGDAALEAELIALKDKGPGIAPRKAAAQSDAAKAALDACFPE